MRTVSARASPRGGEQRAALSPGAVSPRVSLAGWGTLHGALCPVVFVSCHMQRDPGREGAAGCLRRPQGTELEGAWPGPPSCARPGTSLSCIPVTLVQPGCVAELSAAAFSGRAGPSGLPLVP